MSNTSFPSGSDPLKGEQSDAKQPEFTLIDDRNGRAQYTHFDASASRKSADDFQQGEKASSKGSISLRFICLLGFIFCVVFGIGMLLWSIALTFLAIISLFQNHNLNRGAKSFWKIFANTFIAGFGFTLGMISPTLGLGLLALYFSLASEVVGEDLLRKVIRRSFSHF